MAPLTKRSATWAGKHSGSPALSHRRHTFGPQDSKAYRPTCDEAESRSGWPITRSRSAAAAGRTRRRPRRSPASRTWRARPATPGSRASAGSSATMQSRSSGEMSGGATMPRQLASSTSTPGPSGSGSRPAPGRPSGRRPVGRRRRICPRREPEMASARSSPETIWSCHSPRPETPAETWPPRIAASASPPPEYGT